MEVVVEVEVPSTLSVVVEFELDVAGFVFEGSRFSVEWPFPSTVLVPDTPSFDEDNDTGSQGGAYSPLKLTPLLSPSGNCLLRKSSIRPRKAAPVPVFVTRRTRSLRSLMTARDFL